MHETLEALKTAWDKEVGGGRDTTAALALSDQYVAEHPAVFAGFDDKTVGECVVLLEAFRDAGLDEREWEVQAWIFHHFEFQNIGGETQAQVRII